MDSQSNNWKKYFNGFVVCPFLISVVGILPLLVTVALVKSDDGKSPSEYLQIIKNKHGNERWRAAYQLSRLVNEGAGIEMTDSLAEQMVVVLNSESKKIGESKARHFLAIAMGRTHHATFFEPLLKSMLATGGNAEIAVFARALGYLGDERAVPHMTELLNHTDATVRHEAVQALGNIGSPASIIPLKGMLADSALDVRWDAAIGLAKLKDDSGKDILSSLLDEAYYADLPHVSPAARDWAMEVAIRTAALLEDPELNSAIRDLTSSRSIKVKQAALSAVKTFSI